MERLFFANYPVAPIVLRDERYSRAVALCAEQTLDALLVFSADSVSKRGPVRFLSNYPTSTQTSAVFFPSAGEPVLLLTYITHLHWARETTWIEDVRLSPGFASGVREVAQERGLTRARIGLVGSDHISGTVLGDITTALPDVTWVSADIAFSAMRQRKTPNDLRLLRESGRIADAGFTAAAGILRPGLAEPDFFGTIEHVLRREGAEGGLVLVGTGSRHNMPFPVPRRIHAGDVVRLSIEPCGPGGFIAQFVRVFTVGRASDEVRDAFALCRAIQEAAVTRLIAGRPVREAAESASNLLKTAGSLREEVALGHGMGLDLSEPPRLSVTDPTQLSPDMVMAVHPGIYYETFGIFVGDTYHVGPTGPMRLSSFPQELVEI